MKTERKTPEPIKRPDLIIEKWDTKLDSEFWWNKLILVMAIIFGMILGYSVGINMG